MARGTAANLNNTHVPRWFERSPNQNEFETTLWTRHRHVRLKTTMGTTGGHVSSLSDTPSAAIGILRLARDAADSLGLVRGAPD